MATLTVIFAVGVALGYFALAFVVLPRIDLVDATPAFRRAFRVGGIAFFAGCGLTHTHIAVHAAANGDLVAWHELVFHALQFVGVWVFVYVAVRMIDVRVEVRRKPDDVLRARVAQLARSNEDLEQFAHVVSHDLHGPLRTAEGFAELLERRGSVQGEARDHLAHLRSSHEQMREILEGVLRYSRAAGEGLDLTELDLNVVVADVLRSLSAEIDASRATVTVGELPTARGDAVQVRQVFQNLIGNSLKFHGDTPPHIEVQAETRGADCAITVRDHGPGVPAPEQEAVFEMFARGGAAGNTDGTGLGLAICKKIVTRHGGRIRLADAPGGGAQVEFTLPG